MVRNHFGPWTAAASTVVATLVGRDTLRARLRLTRLRRSGRRDAVATNRRVERVDAPDVVLAGGERVKSLRRIDALARAAHEAAKETFKNEPGPVDDAAKLIADMVAMGTHIGLDPKQSNFG